MTVKGFFKSNVFKCLVTLLCVLLVSGIFLTVMNGLLAVSDQERLDRAINKIYGKPVAYTEVDVANYNDNATINAAYRIRDDGNYLVRVTGKGGFDNGTVTCWVVVSVSNGAINGIDKVVIDSNTGQSYIDRITNNVLNEFTEKYEDGIIYTPTLITSATVTSTKNAICNAVNGAIDYVNGKWLGNVTTEGQKLLTSLQTIYGEKEISVYGAGDEPITAESEEITSLITSDVKQGNATISNIYKVKFNDGQNDVLHYVVESTGTGGYKGGTVTVLAAINVVGGKPSTVYKVAITGNVSQSQIGDIDYLWQFENADISNGMIFVAVKPDQFVTVNSTLSSNAINNAVNGAVAYLFSGELQLEDDSVTDEPDNDEDDGSQGGETEEGGNENE